MLLRNHGRHKTIQLLEVNLEEQKRFINTLEETFLQKICMKRKIIEEKLKSANVMHRVDMKKNPVILKSIEFF